MQKDCKQCEESFEILAEDRELYDKVSPFFHEERFLIPNPVYCPWCRFIRRNAFRNENVLYKRQSSLSNNPVISIYSPDKPYKVYSYDEWWSEDFDALDYGRDFDFNRPFFEQFDELFKDVPKLNLIQDGTSENSDYTNYGSHNKNCYLTVGLKSEDAYYSTAIFSKDVCDSLFVVGSERLYECMDCDKCYNSFYLQNCDQCVDSYFLESCIACKNCLGCKNLKHKEYHIFNKAYSKEEYEELYNLYKLDTYTGIQEFKKQFDEFKLTLPFKAFNHKSSENSTGDFLEGAKNCHCCFKVIREAEHCRYSVQIGLNRKDIIDSNNADGELHCQADGVLNSQRILFSHYMRNCSEILYSAFCYNSKNLFGCTGLKRKEYCILNKQYTKDEYDLMVHKILKHMEKTGEWGQYFPPNISAFGYNESYSYGFLPMPKEIVLKSKYKWADYEPAVVAKRRILAKDLPEKISNVESMKDVAIVCEVTGRLFKIIPQELEFYRKHNLPLPRRHYYQRYLDRMDRRNPYKLWKRKCDKCSKIIETSFAPNGSETVYCEKCYLAEVY